MRVPLSRTKSPPAFSTYRWCRLKSACRDVVGVSLAAPSAFLSGANSSSRRTSHAAKLLSHLTETHTDNPHARTHTEGVEAWAEYGYDWRENAIEKTMKDLGQP